MSGDYYPKKIIDDIIKLHQVFNVVSPIEVSPMIPTDLQAAIERTKAQIYQVKQQIEGATDPQEKQRLKRCLKELQHLQLWHLDQLG